MNELIDGYQFVGPGKYKTLRPAPPGWILTAAVITCASCGKIIAGMGGPRSSCYCPTCFDAKKLEAFARGKLLECVDETL
jgi:hypothetical protein